MRDAHEMGPARFSDGITRHRDVTWLRRLLGRTSFGRKRISVHEVEAEEEHPASH